MEIRFQTTERPIVRGVLNGRGSCFLLDTGASVGMLHDGLGGLHPSGRQLSVVDASGDELRCPVLNDTVEVGGRTLAQFIASDLSGVRGSILRETGVAIDGIIGYRQMKFIGARMDMARGVLSL